MLRGACNGDVSFTPTTYYNQVKHAAERVVLSYAHQIGVHIVRPGAVCGLSPRMRLETTVNQLTIRALTDGKVTIYGGSQIRPFVNIIDMARAYVWLLQREPAGPGGSIFNVSFQNMTVRDVGHRVCDLTGAKLESVPTEDTRSYRMDSSKIKAAGLTTRLRRYAMRLRRAS